MQQPGSAAGAGPNGIRLLGGGNGCSSYMAAGCTALESHCCAVQAQCGTCVNHTLQAPRSGSRRASSTPSQDPVGGPIETDTDFDLFRAMFGKPRSAAEGKKFGRAWRQWQAAAVHADSSDSIGSSSHSSRDGGGSGRWRASYGSSSRFSGSSSGSASSSSSSCGSAGASAGARWGQASWTWEDFQQPGFGGGGSSSGGFPGFASWDFEAWYTASPAGGHARRRAAGSAWGWHTAWQHGSGGSSTWQHSSSSGASSPGMSSSVQRNMQLLGLEHSWLSLRCGRALRRAYLAKVKAHHPDLHASSGNAAAAEHSFKAVQAAYQALLALVVP